MRMWSQRISAQPPEESDAVATAEYVLTVNGSSVQLRVPPGTMLSQLLRDRGYTSVKHACERGECGACTVLIDGQPRLACMTLAARITGAVETAEGMEAETADLRAAFADFGAFQCGFCTPGQVVQAASILRQGVPDGETAECTLRKRLSGNICRCTGYVGIIDAVQAVAEQRRRQR